MSRKSVYIAALLTAAAVVGCQAESDHHRIVVADDLPRYASSPLSSLTISGTLRVQGSNTVSGIMLLLSEGFRRHHPAVQFQLQAPGSDYGAAALIAGTTGIATMSRRMTESEIAEFAARHGDEPIAIPLAMDALAVFVHQDNPLYEISLPELAAIFSATDRSEKEGLQPVGRSKDSGTYSEFRRLALNGVDFDYTRYLPLQGSSRVVRYIADNRQAIGYSGIGYATTGVKALSVARSPEAAAIAPSPATARSGEYPLSRTLFLYIHPAHMSPAVRAFLDYALSYEGQLAIAQDGFFPLSRDSLLKARRQLGFS